MTCHHVVGHCEEEQNHAKACEGASIGSAAVRTPKKTSRLTERYRPDDGHNPMHRRLNGPREPDEANGEDDPAETADGETRLGREGTAVLLELDDVALIDKDVDDYAQHRAYADADECDCARRGKVSSARAMESLKAAHGLLVLVPNRVAAGK